MKSRSKILMLALAVFTLALPLRSVAHAVDGDRTGNGGGGVHREGRYMTFYSAGLRVEPDPQTSAEIPGLDTFDQAVDAMEFLTEDARLKLKMTVLPSPQHEYYKVNEEDLDPATMAALVAEYHRVTKVDAKDITLFAITDKGKRQTFLLPAFYKISNPVGQAAILFHEAYWLSRPNADYSEVINTEMSFQAVVEQPDSPERILDFMGRFASVPEQFIYAVKTDLASGSLNGLVDAHNLVSLADLFGTRYFDCMREKGVQCSVYANEWLSEVVQRHPRSLFLKLLLRSAIPRDPAEDVIATTDHWGFWVYVNPKNPHEPPYAAFTPDEINWSVVKHAYETNHYSIYQDSYRTVSGFGSKRVSGLGSIISLQDNVAGSFYDKGRALLDTQWKSIQVGPQFLRMSLSIQQPTNNPADDHFLMWDVNYLKRDTRYGLYEISFWPRPDLVDSWSGR